MGCKKYSGEFTWEKPPIHVMMFLDSTDLSNVINTIKFPNGKSNVVSIVSDSSGDFYFLHDRYVRKYDRNGLFLWEVDTNDLVDNPSSPNANRLFINDSDEIYIPRNGLAIIDTEGDLIAYRNSAPTYTVLNIRPNGDYYTYYFDDAGSFEEVNLFLVSRSTGSILVTYNTFLSSQQSFAGHTVDSSGNLFLGNVTNSSLPARIRKFLDSSSDLWSGVAKGLILLPDDAGGVIAHDENVIYWESDGATKNWENSFAVTPVGVNTNTKLFSSHWFSSRNSATGTVNKIRLSDGAVVDDGDYLSPAINKWLDYNGIDRIAMYVGAREYDGQDSIDFDP